MLARLIGSAAVVAISTSNYLSLKNQEENKESMEQLSNHLKLMDREDTFAILRTSVHSDPAFSVTKVYSTEEINKMMQRQKEKKLSEYQDRISTIEQRINEMKNSSFS